MATHSPNPPHRVPLAAPPEQRGFLQSTDAKLVNVVAEQYADGQVRVQKRPAYVEAAPRAGGSGPGRGIYYWNRALELVWITGGALLDTLGHNNAISASAPYGVYWFNETQGTTNYLYLSNGSVGYTFSSPGFSLSQIVDPNYPLSTVPGSAYLDGTLYVMDGQANIWGSAINNPTSWNALNVIVAQVEPDTGVAIAKQAVYVVAFKQWTTEIFYDASNAVGSPLLPAQNAKVPWGCTNPLSVQSVDDVLYWMGSNKTTTPVILKMDKLRVEKISTPAVERVISQTSVAITTNGAAPTINSFVFRIPGHTLYGLAITGNGTDPSTTLVYDIDAKLWYFWNYVGTGIPFVGAASVGFNSSSFDLVGTNLFQRQTDGTKFYSLSNTVFSDTLQAGGANPIVCDIITPNVDGGTKFKKVLSRLKVVADQNSAGTIQIRWSDDDYKTWTTWRTVNLQSDLPQLVNLGTFRRRAFHLRHNLPTALRLESIELDLLLGTF